MIGISIPDFGDLALTHLVVDYNGTLAVDGRLLPGVGHLLRSVSQSLEIHVVTADTFGLAAQELDGLPLRLIVLPKESQAQAKFQHVSNLGCDRVVAVGNGRNDRLMLDAAALGIALVQREGGSTEAIAAASLVSANILDALELLVHPKRLVASLRS